MWREMTSSPHVELYVLLYKLVLVAVSAARLPHPAPSKISLSSLLDSALPSIHPIIAAGSNKCEAFKSIFGLTYDQMQEKNSTNLDALNIDLITKYRNIKFNLTAVKRINRIMENAKTIVILIHGFLESSDGLMVRGLAPELLKKSGLKILALDGRRMINLEYFRSSTYARFMGEKLGALLSEIIKNGQDPSKITLIGHSLGAHIAGIAGKRVRNETDKVIGRIAALDPAGPCFSSVDEASRLGQADAAYVDVIHTNGGVLGLKEPVARKCDNWTMFQEGLCAKNEVSFMGLSSEPGTPGLYFLTTGPSAPFGLGPKGSG